MFIVKPSSGSDLGFQQREPLERRSFLIENEHVVLAELDPKLVRNIDWKGHVPDGSENNDELALPALVQERDLASMTRGGSAEKVQKDGTGQLAAQGAVLDWTLRNECSFDGEEAENQHLAALQKPEGDNTGKVDSSRQTMLLFGWRVSGWKTRGRSWSIGEAS